MAEDAVARRLVIHGRVQGVFFRATLRGVAEQAGVGGWAVNRADGTVEVLLEGSVEAVERVTEFAHQGPEHAHVERVEVSDRTPEGRARFEIR